MVVLLIPSAWKWDFRLKPAEKWKSSRGNGRLQKQLCKHELAGLGREKQRVFVLNPVNQERTATR